MRYYPPAEPCDEPLCLTLAEHEIVKETPGGQARVAALACTWHVQSLWRDTIAQYMERPGSEPQAAGFYVQRHVV